MIINKRAECQLSGKEIREARDQSVASRQLSLVPPGAERRGFARPLYSRDQMILWPLILWQEASLRDLRMMERMNGNA
jgi:hypothetical protein